MGLILCFFGYCFSAGILSFRCSQAGTRKDSGDYVLLFVLTGIGAAITTVLVCIFPWSEMTIHDLILDFGSLFVGGLALAWFLTLLFLPREIREYRELKR